MEASGARTGELRIGDHIEAWHNGKIFHRGRVTAVVPALELFWILDERTGTRKLLDPEALRIVVTGPPDGELPDGKLVGVRRSA